MNANQRSLTKIPIIPIKRVQICNLTIRWNILKLPWTWLEVVLADEAPVPGPWWPIMSISEKRFGSDLFYYVNHMLRGRSWDLWITAVRVSNLPVVPSVVPACRRPWPQPWLSQYRKCVRQSGRVRLCGRWELSRPHRWQTSPVISDSATPTCRLHL